MAARPRTPPQTSEPQTEPEAQAGPALRLFIPPDPKFGSYVRKRVVDFTAGRGVSELDLEEFVSAVFEAFANALEHSRSQDPIQIRCWSLGEDQLLATVIDRGIGFKTTVDASEPKLPEPLEERGRGLPLMRRFTDRFRVQSVPGKGTAVTLGRYVRRVPSPSHIAG